MDYLSALFWLCILLAWGKQSDHFLVVIQWLIECAVVNLTLCIWHRPVMSLFDSWQSSAGCMKEIEPNLIADNHLVQVAPNQRNSSVA